MGEGYGYRGSAYPVAAVTASAAMDGGALAWVGEEAMDGGALAWVGEEAMDGGALPGLARRCGPCGLERWISPLKSLSKGGQNKFCPPLFSICVVVLITGTGPTDTVYENPADDPTQNP